MAEEEDKTARDKLGEAVRDWANHDGAKIVVGWHCIVELVDAEDGEPYLAELSNKESTLWQRMGYLSASLATERNAWASLDAES